MKHIWMYWENAPGSGGMPPFVQLCVETVRRRSGNATLHLLDERSVQDFLPRLRPEWHTLRKIAHKADYIRTRLVLEHGGLWLDCDMVALRPLDPLFDIPEPLDFACQDIRGAIGCFVAKPGSMLLKQVAAAQDEILDDCSTDLPWGAIGNDLLKRFGPQYPHHRWVEWTVDHPPNGRVSKLLSPRLRVEELVDANAVLFDCFGTNLTPLLDTYARHRHRSLLKQQMLLSRILRRGLGLPEPSWAERLTNFAVLHDLGAAALRRLATATT